MAAPAPQLVAPRSAAALAAFRRLGRAYRDFLLALPPPDDAAVLAAYPQDLHGRQILAEAETACRLPTGQSRRGLPDGEPVSCGTVQTPAPGDAEIKRVGIAPQRRVPARTGRR